MAKKILGDDPFRSASEPAPSNASKNGKGAKGPTRAKRAPIRKTEAPKATRARKVDPVDEHTVPPVNESAPAESAAIAAPTVAAEVPVTQALAPLPQPVASEGAQPGSWQWWRSRQLQLARAEASVFLSRTDGLTDRFGRDPQLAGRAEPIVDFLYRSWLRVSVRGLGHVPDSGRAILVAKQRASSSVGLWGMARAAVGLGNTPPALDAAVIAHAVRTEHVSHREVRPLVRAKRLYMPIVGKLLRRLGGVPSELHDFARLLDDDMLALAFVDSAIGPHALDTSTLVSLALVTGSPIVPVVVSSSIDGTGRFGLLRPSRKTTLSFGTPLYPATEYGPEGAEDDQLVARLAGELEEQLG